MEKLKHFKSDESDMNQTCSGPMVRKIETIRRVEMTDEQLDEFRLGNQTLKHVFVAIRMDGRY